MRVLLASICLLGSLGASQLCLGREIIVDLNGGGDFAAIQPAVDSAGPGDVVTVRRGLYRESVRLVGKCGTKERPIVLQADPAAPPGSVIIDGSRPAPPELWSRFVSKRYRVRLEHNVWWTAHNPETDYGPDELTQPAWPYKLHKGYYSWDGKTTGPEVTARWGTCALFQGDRRLDLVPTDPNVGKMSDRHHADSEETQSEEYITAYHAKFFQPGEWIWYDDGRTDGADADETPVSHPAELQNRIFLRLPAGQAPHDLSYTVKSVGVLVKDCRHVIVRGLRIRRAQTGVVAKGGRDIRLHGLIVEEFGGSRKYRPTIPGPGVPNIHVYYGGSGIHLGSSASEIVGAVVQNGLQQGIGCGRRDSPIKGLRILSCTVRDIRSHPWGGGWAHGRGKGIGLGNCSDVLVARNVVQDCSHNGCWIDNDPTVGTCGNIRIIENIFDNCGRRAIYSELNVDQVLIAYNVVVDCLTGVSVGPVSRRSRVLGNLFHNIRSYGGELAVYDRTGGRTDTIDYFALGGNVFSNCRWNFTWSDKSLLNGKQYFARNIWHVGADSNDRQGYFEVDDPKMDFASAWAQLRSEKFVAAAEGSRVVARSPVTEQPDGTLICQPSPSSLVTDELLDDLLAKGFLSAEERSFLKTWRQKTADDLAPGVLPAGWDKPGSPLAGRLTATSRPAAEGP